MKIVSKKTKKMMKTKNDVYMVDFFHWRNVKVDEKFNFGLNMDFHSIRIFILICNRDPRE